jgi:hypothetical protein
MATRTVKPADDSSFRNVQIIKEYTEKFRNIGETLRKSYKQIANSQNTPQNDPAHLDVVSSVHLARQMFPAASQLAQAISQRIEHGSLADIAQLELKLRLSEFEAVLREVQVLTASQLAFDSNSAVMNVYHIAL